MPSFKLHVIVAVRGLRAFLDLDMGFARDRIALERTKARRLEQAEQRMDELGGSTPGQGRELAPISQSWSGLDRNPV